jgi:hypothetical protein
MVALDDEDGQMGPSRRESLSEGEMVGIIHLDLNGLGQAAINRDMNPPESPIPIFLISYEKHGKPFPRRGRPVLERPALDMVDAAMNELEANHRFT